MEYLWENTLKVKPRSYTCGHCGCKVGPHQGYYSGLEGPKGEKISGSNAYIFICPNCTKPTFFDFDGKQVPGIRIGNDVAGITNEGVRILYDEARDCTTLGAHTAAVLICRKILMNVAVDQGAQEGKSFLDYIEYLADQGYVPPNGKAWVDAIREKGNEANHEIRIMSRKESGQILRFVEMLLRFIYEFPTMLEKTPECDGPVENTKPDKGDGIWRVP